MVNILIPELEMFLGIGQSQYTDYLAILDQRECDQRPGGYSQVDFRADALGCALVTGHIGKVNRRLAGYSNGECAVTF